MSNRPWPQRIGALIVLGTLSSLAAAAAAPRTIAIKANDNMRYSITRIDATAGETLKVTITSTSAMAKDAMAHNFVLLDAATKVVDFITASAMARRTDYIAPAFQKQILAQTAMAGNGETVEVTFTAPKTPGIYPFVCTFPGHYNGGMKGELVVK
jgi:azurin